jgi:hypothetical protein
MEVRVAEEGQRRVRRAVCLTERCQFIMVRGHFLGGYLRPDIATWILQGALTTATTSRRRSVKRTTTPSAVATAQPCAALRRAHNWPITGSG